MFFCHIPFLSLKIQITVVKNSRHKKGCVYKPSSPEYKPPCISPPKNEFYDNLTAFKILFMWMTHGTNYNQSIETILNILNPKRSQLMIHHVVRYHQINNKLIVGEMVQSCCGKINQSYHFRNQMISITLRAMIQS